MIKQFCRMLAVAAPDVYMRFISSAPDTVEGRDMEQLNNYWRIQLGMLSVTTIDERGYLEDGIPESEWLGNFQRHVLPTIQRYGLPHI